MATFSVQVSDLTTFASTDDTALASWLADGCKEIINVMPEEMLVKVSGESGDFTPTAGTNVTATIIGVTRKTTTSGGNTFECREIPYYKRNESQDEDNILYATETDPVYYIEPQSGTSANKIKGLPLSSSNLCNAVTIQYPAPDVGDSSISLFPDEAEYLVVLYTSVKALHRLMNDKSSSLPSDITSIVLAQVSTSLPSFTAPDSFILPVSPAGADVSFSDVGTLPSFVKPVFSAPSLATLPSIPIQPVLGSTTVSFSTDVPTYIAPVVSLGLITVSDLTISSALSVAPVLSDNSITFSTAVPTYIAPVVSPNFSDANTWLNTEEDSELVTSRVQIISAQLQEYQANIENATNKFNKENTQYQTELQEAIENAKLSSKDDSQKLQKYSSEIQSYQADVNTQVQKYQQNFQKDFQIWQAERATELQKYGSDITNALNKFNKENTEYQAQLQISIQNAQLENQDDGLKLQKYQSEVQAYQAEVNTSIQNYQIDYGQLLAEYGQNIQVETSRLNAEVQDFQAEVAKSIQKYQAETGYDMSKYQAEIQAYTQKYQSDLSKNTVDFSSNLQKYTSDVQKVGQDNQNTLAKYSQDIANYGAKIQKHSTDYQWYQSQYVQLKADYQQGLQLLISGGQPPPQQQRQRQARG